MEEEVAEFFSQLKDFPVAGVEEVKETEIIEEIVHETTVTCSTDSPATSIMDCEISASFEDSTTDSTTEKLQIITSEEITDTSTDSHDVVAVATTAAEPPVAAAEGDDNVLDLLFSNVPRGYLDGKGEQFLKFNFSTF